MALLVFNDLLVRNQIRRSVVYDVRVCLLEVKLGKIECVLVSLFLVVAELWDRGDLLLRIEALQCHIYAGGLGFGQFLSLINGGSVNVEVDYLRRKVHCAHRDVSPRDTDRDLEPA